VKRVAVVMFSQERAKRAIAHADHRLPSFDDRTAIGGRFCRGCAARMNGGLCRLFRR
jgi:hypothetical protein